jgi:allantoinase
MRCPESGDFLAAQAGIASLELSLAVVWSEARGRGYQPEVLAEWMGSGPASVVGLGRRKGRIAPGYDADLVLFRPDGELRVRPGVLHQRHKLTPYLGETLHGVVEATYLRGQRVYERGTFPSVPRGRWLSRSAAR